VRRPTPRRSSSYSRLTARVAWRRALQRQGVAAGLGRSLLILNVYAGVRQMSREAADKTQPCVGRNRDRARGGRLTSARIAVPPICSGHIDRRFETCCGENGPSAPPPRSILWRSPPSIATRPATGRLRILKRSFPTGVLI